MYITDEFSDSMACNAETQTRRCTQRTQKQSYKLMISLWKAILNIRTKLIRIYGNKNKLRVWQIQRPGNDKLVNLIF
jgi:hypothetical protein